MLQDDKPEGAVTVGGTGEVREATTEHRRAARRKLPFGRGAVLDVNGRSHIVGLADVSVTGAYVSTRAPVSVGETHRLRLLILPSRTELVLSVRVVRIAQVAGESSDHPRGVAVQFLHLDDEARRRLEAFVTRQLKKSPRP